MAARLGYALDKLYRSYPAAYDAHGGPNNNDGVRLPATEHFKHMFASAQGGGGGGASAASCAADEAPPPAAPSGPARDGIVAALAAAVCILAIALVAAVALLLFQSRRPSCPRQMSEGQRTPMMELATVKTGPGGSNAL